MLLNAWTTAVLAQPQNASTSAPSEINGTYVNDSFEVREALTRLSLLESRQQWNEAARVAQSLLTSQATQLVGLKNGIYQSLVYRLNRIIAHWPAAGLNTYRRLYDPLAGEARSQAVTQHDRQHLAALLDEYLCTSEGPRIAFALYELAVEAGQFDLARRACLRVLEDHPDSPLHAGALTARLAIIASLTGDESRVRHWLDEHDAVGGTGLVRWNGRDEPLVQLVRALASDVRALSPPDDSADWPVFAGNLSRNRVVPLKLDGAERLWRFDEMIPQLNDALSTRETGSARRPIDTCKLLVYNPVASNGVVYMQSASEVWAVHSVSGQRIWRYRGLDTDTPLVRSEPSPTDWFVPTVKSGRLYACLGSETGSYYTYDAPSELASIVCVDVDKGQEIWRADEASLGPDFAKTSFGTAPIVTDEGVFVVARRRRTFGFEDAYLLKLDARDGAFRFRTHLGSASIGGFGFRRPTVSIPGMVHDTIYVATNLGSVAAVNAYTGAVRWLRTYPRESDNDWQGQSRAYAREAGTWQFNPIICDGDRLICKPTDTASILIMDRHSGDVLRTIENEDTSPATSILGVSKGRLFSVDENVVCIDLQNDDRVWTQSLPEDATLHGRGTLIEGHVLVPMKDRLYIYNMDDGARTELPWNASDSGGHLVALSGQLLVASHQQLSAYGRRSDVWAGLQARMRERSHDPTPALDLAEMAFRLGKWNECDLALTEALDRAGDFTSKGAQSIRARLFKDCLWFAQDWQSHDDNASRVVEQFYEHAARSAPDRASHVEYRVRYAEFLVEQERPTEAIALYQQIINDRSLRDVLTTFDESANPAGDLAITRIEQLIAEKGRSVYEDYDREAAAWIEQARTTGNLDPLDRIITTRPASIVTTDALLLKAQLLAGRNQFREAARVYATAFRCHPEQIDAVTVLRKIVDCYVDANRPDLAWQWLTKAELEHPAARIQTDRGPLSFREYRRQLGIERQTFEPKRPTITPPLAEQYQLWFSEQVTLLEPLLPPTSQSDASLLLIYESDRIDAYDSQTGKSVWKEPALCRHQPQLLMATRDWLLFATDHIVFAVDPRTGRRLWEGGYRPEDLTDPSTDPESFASWIGHAIDRDHILSMRDDGTTVCAQITDGHVLWQQRLEHRPVTTPVLTEDTVAYQGRTGDQHFLCILDARTGQTIRNISTGDTRPTQMHLTAEGTLLILSARTLEAYDIHTGRRLWRNNAEGYIFEPTVQFDLDGVYYCDDTTHVKKNGLDDGARLWRSEPLFRMGMQHAQSTLIRGRNLTVTDREAFALDTLDGRTIWEAPVVPNADFRYAFFTHDHIIAIDVQEADDDVNLSAHFMRHTAARPPRPDQDDVIEIGPQHELRNVVLRDGALIIQDGRSIHGWSEDRPSKSDSVAPVK